MAVEALWTAGGEAEVVHIGWSKKMSMVAVAVKSAFSWLFM